MSQVQHTVRRFPQSSVDMSDTGEKTQLLPPQRFTTATTGSSTLRKWLNGEIARLAKLPLSCSLFFHCLNFISADVLNIFTVTARCSFKPSQATAHMGPLRQAFIALSSSMQSRCATTENRGNDRIWHWQVAAASVCQSIHHWAPGRVKSFYISSATLLIFHSQFPGKSVNVSRISITGMRIHVAVQTTFITAQTKQSRTATLI